MKKFSFPLDRALAVRRLQCEQEKAALMRCLAESQAVTQREQSVRAERAASEEPLSRAIFLDAHEVTTLVHWQAHMKTTLSQMAALQRQADEKVTAQQTRMREAERRVKLLERLRERRLASWQTEVSREEEAFAAEVYLARCIRLRRDNPRVRSSGG